MLRAPRIMWRTTSATLRSRRIPLLTALRRAKVHDRWTRGTTSRSESGSRTELAATNGVEHVIYLEYGTRKMAPREMVRRSLEEVRELVADGAFGGVLG